MGDIGVLEKVSGWWRADAWPDPNDPPFLNLCVQLKTSLGPVDLLIRLLEIEREFGRERKRPNAPRTLDLDLVALGAVTLNEPAAGDRPRLELPHPRMHERAFVLLPFADVAPEWRHPKLGATAADLVARLTPEQRASVRRTPAGLDVI